MNRVDRLALRIPQPPRHPLILWMMAAIAVSVAPAALGLVELPGSLERLPALIGRLGVTCTAGGALFVTMGQLWWRNRKVGIGGWERGGTWLMSAGSGLYAVALLFAASWAQRSVAFGQSLGLTLGCAAYGVWIQLWLRGLTLKGTP